MAIRVGAGPWPEGTEATVLFSERIGPVLSRKLARSRGFIESGKDCVALRRTRRHRKSALLCEWLQAEARAFSARGEQR